MKKFTKLTLTLAMLFGIVGGVKAGNHYLQITTNAAKTNAWDWGVQYNLDTPLESGKTYVLTMDARCSEEYDISFWPCNTAAEGKTKYTGFKIGTEWSTCVCEFEANDALNQLVWNFGTLNGFLRFDNIKLVEKGTTTNLITGGDFESGLDTHWATSWNNPVYSIYESESTPTRSLKMSTNEVKTNAWEWAIWYLLDTPLKNGKTYVLTMKAKCSEAFKMPFWPYKTGEGGKTVYKDYDIGTEWGDCSCTFTANDDLTHLKWCFGSLNGTVWFDDVKLVEQGTTTNLINDGGFDDGIASNWGDDGWNSPQYGVAIDYPEFKAIVPDPEADLSSSYYNHPASCTVNVKNEEQGEGSLIFGDANVHYTNYADLSSCSGIKIYGSGSPLRVMYNRPEGEGNGGTCPEIQVTPTANGTLLDISSYSPFHLNAIKVSWGGNSTITKVSVIDPSVPTGVDYMLSGDYKDGLTSTTVTDALADDAAKVIDVTGVKGSGIELTSANPNCLFIAASGKLSNDKNVIVSGNCANLALTDSYPFKAPSTFTVTAAPTYSRAFTASKTTTVCLPFALTEEEAASLGTFYGLNSFDGGNTLHFTTVAEPEANKAYLVVPKATGLTLSETGKSIVATPADLGTGVTNVDFIGTLAATEIPASDGSYSYYAYNNGSLVKIVDNAVTLPAFRGYFRVETTAISTAPVLNIVFDSQTTGVIDVRSNMSDVRSDFFDLQGRRIAQPTKGLYIVNGKKVVIK